jgi:exodeoxyribonuclease VII large subunit
MNATTPDARRVFSVREFAAELDRLFQRRTGLANIAIRGEITGLGEFGTGHLKFTLKEQEAVLDCIVWSDRRRRIPELRNGVAAIATGSIRVRQERSGYQLLVDGVELVGIGELFVLYERLKEKFRREGLFEAQRKRPVPELPRRIALVSARGKAAEDFMRTIQRNVPFVEVIFIETRVQGIGAEIDIAQALDEASRSGADAIVLTRGGGTYEDLFAFNLEPVIRAIVRAKAPVLTAIGHSGDHHLADEVADLSFGTPSLAAEHIAKGWMLAERRLGMLQRDLDRAVRTLQIRLEQRVDARRKELQRCGLRVVSIKRSSLAQSGQRLERRNPQRVLAEMRTRSVQLSIRLDGAIERRISRPRQRLTDLDGKLNREIGERRTALSRRLELTESILERFDPLAPLVRGYAIVGRNGKTLRNAGSVRVGELIEARLQHGSLDARVESVRLDE